MRINVKKKLSSHDTVKIEARLPYLVDYWKNVWIYWRDFYIETGASNAGELISLLNPIAAIVKTP